MSFNAIKYYVFFYKSLSRIMASIGPYITPEKCKRYSAPLLQTGLQENLSIDNVCISK